MASKVLVRAAVVLAIIGGCAPSAADPRICDAAAQLVTSINTTVRAQAADKAGDKSVAQLLASRAADQALEAHDNLDAITSDAVRQSDAWLFLLDTYRHVSQAANALLPEYSGTYGITAAEIDLAVRALIQADGFAGCPLPSGLVT